MSKEGPLRQAFINAVELLHLRNASTPPPSFSSPLYLPACFQSPSSLSFSFFSWGQSVPSPSIHSFPMFFFFSPITPPSHLLPPPLSVSPRHLISFSFSLFEMPVADPSGLRRECVPTPFSQRVKSLSEEGDGGAGR